MDNRLVEFGRGLRAAGVSASLAELLDAFHAVEEVGVQNRALFRAALRTTLVKEVRHFETFDELFPLYFGRGEPPLQDVAEFLTAVEQSQLQQALSQFDERIQQLLEWLTSGDGPTAVELQQLAEQSGLQWLHDPQQSLWLTKRMLQQMGFGQLPEKLNQLLQTLRDMGLGRETIERISGVIEINQQLIREQVAEQAGLEIARRRADRPTELHGPDLMHKSFHALTPAEISQLRFELQRLIQQLRTRAALRRKRQKSGQLDARRTIRHSQRYAGVPFELKYRHRKLKPKIVFIFDASNSMQRVVEFMLYFVTEMQDQVSRLRSFAFYDNLGEVSDILRQLDMRVPHKAFYEVQRGIPGYLYGTNLGRSLQTFYDQHLSAVDRHTTVIIMGDGRNNHYDPRLDLVHDLQKRAKQLIWFTPENERLWGTGDSDMNLYAPLCDAVYPVRNLAQLSTAVDKIMTN